MSPDARYFRSNSEQYKIGSYCPIYKANRQIALFMVFKRMILIVDDNQENIFSLKTLLELHNFSVDTASSGEEALKRGLKNTYSLIVLDVQMPGMDGFEVAEAISGYSKIGRASCRGRLRVGVGVVLGGT